MDLYIFLFIFNIFIFIIIITHTHTQTPLDDPIAVEILLLGHNVCDVQFRDVRKLFDDVDNDFNDTEDLYDDSDDDDDCDYCDYCYDQCLVIVIIVMFKADRSIRKASHLLPVALSPLSRLQAAASDVLQRNINKNKTNTPQGKKSHISRFSLNFPKI